MANCPKCGSLLKYELRSAGTTSKTKYYRTGVKKSWIIPAGRKTTKSQRSTYVDAYCPKCGYHPPVEAQKGDSKRFWIILGVIILIGIIGSTLRGNKNTNNKTSKATTTPIAQQAAAQPDEAPESLPADTKQPEPTESITENVAAAEATEAPTATPTSELTATPIPDSVWALAPTSLDHFEYYLDGDKIYLTNYDSANSHNAKIWIADAYTINGKTYTLGEQLKGIHFSSIESAIIPEGVVHIEKYIFNSCGVKYVYLPKSLSFDDENPHWFFDYFHNLEKLYYGGSEAEWKNLIGDTKREDIDVKQIIFDASLSELLPWYDFSTTSPTQYSEETIPSDIWATSFTDLSNFDFYIDGDYIYLKDYIGKEKKIWLATQYEYEGKQYKLNENLENLEINRATSLIIPEGITTISWKTIPSNDLKYLYIPKSITPENANSFYTNFYNIDTIYYGGSQEEWLTLTEGTDRSKLKVRQILFDIDYNTLTNINPTTESSTGNTQAENEIIEKLRTVPDIAYIEAATEDTDPNNQLGKQGCYTSYIFFSSPLVDPAYATKDHFDKLATEYGGSIEIYATTADAEKRNEYLASFDGTAFVSGSHTIYGTMIIRTSHKLKASQQKKLEQEIIDALSTK